MKKFLHVLTGLFVLLTSLLWGGLLVYANAFNNGFRDFIFETMQNSPVLGVILGLLLILIFFIYLGTFGPARPRMKTLSFDSESGAVSISMNAVSDFIQKLGDEFGAVISLSPRIRSEKGFISIDLDVKIQTGTRIPELSQLLQDRVRESVRDGLGIVDIREIRVHIHEIVGAPPPSQAV